MVFPVTLGEGVYLFREGSGTRNLSLVDTKTTSTGLGVHTYEPA